MVLDGLRIKQTLSRAFADSDLSDGSAFRVASTPLLLCSRCSTLDFAKCLTEPESESQWWKPGHLLGTIDDVLKRSTCNFCQLVVETFRSACPELVSGARALIPRQYDQPIHIYLDSGSAQFKLPSPGKKHRQDINCLLVYTDFEFPSFIAEAE